MSFEIDPAAYSGSSGISSVHGAGATDPLTRQMRRAGHMQAHDSVHFSGSHGQRKKKGFSLFNAVKETVKGFFRPIAAIVQHPVKAALAIAGVMALAAVAPVTIPVMVGLGLAMGGFQLAKGAGTAISAYSRGDYAAAEKAFGDIGEGVFAVGSSALGVRQAGAIAAESRATAAGLKAAEGLQGAERAAAMKNVISQGLAEAEKVRAGTWTEALKEVGRTFSRKNFETFKYQFAPKRVNSIMQAQWDDFTGLFKNEASLDGLKQALGRAPEKPGFLDKLPGPLRNFLGNLYERYGARYARMAQHPKAPQTPDEIKAALERGESPYQGVTRDAGEISARRNEATARIRKAQRLMAKQDATPAELADAAANYRSGLLERRMNNLLAQLNRTKNPAKAAELEQELQAIARVWDPVRANTTRGMVQGDARMQNAARTGMRVRNEQQRPDAAQSLWGRVRGFFEGLFHNGINREQVETAVRGFERNHESLTPFYIQTAASDNR